MGLRGETVGTAYIRILADGSSLDKSIEKEMQGHDDVFESAGRKDQQTYNKARQEELDKPPVLLNLQKRMLAQRGRFDAIGTIHGSEYIHGLIETMKSGFNDDVGERLGIKLREGLRRTMDADFITKFVDEIAVHVNEVTEDIIRDENKTIDEFKKNFGRALRDIEQRHKRTTGSIADHQRLLDGVFERSSDAIRQFALNGEGDLNKVAKAFERNFRKMRSATSTTGRDTHKLSGIMLQFSDAAGAAFGRGSRNNFLNFFGSVVRNVSSLAGHFVRLGESIGGIFKKMSSLGDSGATFGETMLTAAKGIGLAVAGLFALGTAAAFVVLIIGPMAALISGISAALVGLAGSLTFAAGAAGGVMLGALLPVAALLGTLIIGFIELANRGKTLEKTFQPVADVFKKIKTEIGDDLLGPLRNSIPTLVDALKLIEPAISGVGDAVGHTIDGFAKVLQSPAFKHFSAALADFLPGAVEDLGQIFNNVFKGMLGVIRSTFPITDEFLGWLKDITGEFSNWANSVEGQKELQRFFRRASDSAKSFFGFVDKVGDAIGKLFDKGKSTGDTIFDDLTKQLDSFIEFLDDNPDAIRDFFKNGLQVARDLGNLVKDLGELFDELDSAENRENLEKTLSFVGHVIDAISFTFGVLDRMISNVTDKFKQLGDLASNIWDGADKATLWLHNRLNDIGKWFKDAWDAILRFTHNSWDAIKNAIIKPITDLWNKLFGHSIIPDIVDGFEHAWDRIKKITKELFDWIGNHSWRPVVDAFNHIKGVLGDVVNLFFDKFGDLKNFVRDAMNDIVEFVRSVPGRLRGLVDNFRGAGKAVIDAFLSGIANAGDFALEFATNVWEVLKEMINDAIDRINDALEFGIHKGPIDIDIDIKDIPPLARGGILRDPRFVLAGEDGPEAVVPLNRPLSQVDPSVRALSAIAQGLAGPGGGKTIDVGGITIVTPTEDPRAVATETVDQLASTGYF